ncbi:dethiobiotin synthase [Methylophilus aquaticus]|uniref:ATP-dependent dethiobiotin synthetase BioD n=1 Tax=Methylophilus aquaticus TaxID=1971610 RepID=A0ABT9JQ19_9PROT|nr:dethiobiotin synthase [Methylophilus aquaticus]MDP8566656.1 dethiobiotin synthase [Methylophilus aquaticus]
MTDLPRHFFVTGTDTGVGKTTVTVHLMQRLVAQGLSVIGMKPVASGCEWIDGVWQNEDVRHLTAAANVAAPPEIINPYCFAPHIAPHIAAAQAGVEIEFKVIQNAYVQLKTLADVVIVEGAGGLLVPLSPAQHTMVDLIQSLRMPALMVVGMRLGCINHALLTAHMLKQRGIPLCGWVANYIDPQMSMPQENLQTLITYLQQPPLLEVPFQESLA